ncbi:MAG: hypothetical protein KDE47_25235 [Caldilineaceae bacterium]|nr:hypothetical protein [Caldilineaceae bacterium]
MNLFLPHEDPSGDDRDDRIQRILNEKKRQELAKRYGASFGESDSSLPADIEAEWLDYIEEFERQFEGAERISVREYLGNPTVVPLAVIPLDNLEEELDQLLEFMYLHGVAVHFLCEVTDTEAYRFIVDELFEEQVDDVRIPGMMTNFIYEEFYPNDEYDAKIWAQDFLFSLFDHHREGIEVAFCKDEIYTIAGAPISHAGMMGRVDAFFQRHPTIVDTKIKPLTSTIDGEYATVAIATTWTSVRTAPADQLQYIGCATFRLKRSDYGGWDVVQAKVPGWDSPV